jgi:SSS family solute:Na+ symporter
MIPLGVVGFILTQIPSTQVFEIQFLYGAGVSFALSILLLVGVSLVTAPPSAEVVENLTWRPELWRKETEELRGTPWYLNYRYLSIALLVTTGIVVVWWA